MESIVVRLDEGHANLLDDVSKEIEANELELAPIYKELDKKREELQAIRERIKPFKYKLSTLGELKAGIASRKSRVKYFPQFATRNYDESKDEEFLEFVRKQINPDKVNG